MQKLMKNESVLLLAVSFLKEIYNQYQSYMLCYVE